MKRSRLGALFGAFLASGALAASAVDCADPTEIVVDVRTDGCADVRNTGIAVGTWDEIDSAPIKVFSNRTGCEPSPPDRIGTLVIFPSGSKESEVAIRVVTGVTKPAEQCAPPYEGCIVKRSRARFVPGKSETLIVIMSRACTGRDCGKDRECAPNGECVAAGGDGGVLVPEPDAAGEDDASTTLDAMADAGRDACVDCVGGGVCNSGVCEFDCENVDCRGKTNLCPPGIDCKFTCRGDGDCSGLQCNAPGHKCTIACGNQSNSCEDIRCNAGGCTVTCNGNGSCDNVSLSGGDASITCMGNNACNDGNAYCDAGRCALACMMGAGNSCPQPRVCAVGSTCVSSPGGGTWDIQ